MLETDKPVFDRLYNIYAELCIRALGDVDPVPDGKTDIAFADTSGTLHTSVCGRDRIPSNASTSMTLPAIAAVLPIGTPLISSSVPGLMGPT
ncbi:MAG: hypothetical protein U0930_11190 [Pirellulales bacterium]